MKLPTKEKMVDSTGRPLTQSLFLELGYSDASVYTLKEDHYEYEGKMYPSIKKLYLECADPTEYEFAQLYFLNWKHWIRISDNKAVKTHVNEWREELEVKLRSIGVKQVRASAELPGGLQAAKWLADRGWSTRGAGRPTKAEIEREKAIQVKVENEYSADVLRFKRVEG